MSDFSELIKNFNKIRDFMRDFYIYGFKSRGDFSVKSARTYDNEKRRCESYLGDAMKWAYSGGSKVSFVSADCGKIPSNPLFSAWKSKSFTDNDILLHFYILGALQDGGRTAEELTEEITRKSGRIFDLQTVRAKCNEYVDLGMLQREKDKKAYRYALSTGSGLLDDELLDAVKFFQSETLGIIGSFILDNARVGNDLFIFKHHYIAHTLDDGILSDILDAIREQRKIEIVLRGTKSGRTVKNRVIPVKIICSFWSGRRYLCAYLPSAKRFSTYRLDAVKSVTPLEQADENGLLREMLERNLDKVWGVSFDGETRNEKGFSFTLKINEQSEQYLIRRLLREGRGGTLERIDENTFRFSKEVFDANEAMPWVKTFIGRIVGFEASPLLEKKLSADIRRMAEMYGVETAGETCNHGETEETDG